MHTVLLWLVIFQRLKSETHSQSFYSSKPNSYHPKTFGLTVSERQNNQSFCAKESAAAAMLSNTDSITLLNLTISSYTEAVQIATFCFRISWISACTRTNYQWSAHFRRKFLARPIKLKYFQLVQSWLSSPRVIHRVSNIFGYTRRQIRPNDNYFCKHWFIVSWPSHIQLKFEKG